jgi:hypothetical protein
VRLSTVRLCGLWSARRSCPNNDNSDQVSLKCSPAVFPTGWNFSWTQHILYIHSGFGDRLRLSLTSLRVLLLLSMIRDAREYTRVTSQKRVIRDSNR